MPAPTVSSVAPSSGPVSGGTNVTITGTGFVATPTVLFGVLPATNVVFVSSTTLTCDTPGQTAAQVDVTVTNPDTQAGVGSKKYTFVAAPSVSAAIPASGSINGGTPIQIIGTAFVATPTVTIGGQPATSVVWVNSTTLTCVTPAHAVGPVSIVVTNPDMQVVTRLNGFTFTTEDQKLCGKNAGWKKKRFGGSGGFF